MMPSLQLRNGEEAGSLNPYHDVASAAQTAAEAAFRDFQLNNMPIADVNRAPQLVRTHHDTTFGQAPIAETRPICNLAAEVQAAASMISNPKAKDYVLDDFKGNGCDYDTEAECAAGTTADGRCECEEHDDQFGPMPVIPKI